MNITNKALLLLVVAALSDGIDGLLARKLNQRSPLGAYLDPIADKLLLSSSFIILAFKQKLAWWLTIIVLSRDVLILMVAVVILLISGYRPFPPSIYGKVTTGLQILLVFMIVLLGGLSAFTICAHQSRFDLCGHGLHGVLRVSLFVQYIEAAQRFVRRWHRLDLHCFQHRPAEEEAAAR